MARNNFALFSLLVASACLLQAATASPAGFFDDLFGGLKAVAQIPTNVVKKKTEIVNNVATEAGQTVDKGIDTAKNVVNAGLKSIDSIFHGILDGNLRTAFDVAQSLVAQGVKFGVEKANNGFNVITFVPNSIGGKSEE